MEIDFDQNENLFKLDYLDQNINDNIKLLKWKKLIIEKNKNNRNLILFKCIKDKVLFYDTYENYYLGLCPICKKYICYFCSFQNNSFNKSDIICCLKRYINICFFINGVTYIKRSGLFNTFSIFFLIPGINILMSGIYLSFMILENIAKRKQKKEQILESINLEEKIIFLIFVILTQFILAIPFLLLNAYFILCLIFISIPFKLIPLKYYLGVFDTKDDGFV